MKQKKLVIKLIDHTGNDHPFGNIKGKSVFASLLDFVNQHPEIFLFEVSLDGIKATDSSFPRESVISVAKHFSGEKFFYLSGFQDDQDLFDNWDYAAKAIKQPLLVWKGSNFELLGPELNKANTSLLNFIHKHQKVTTSEAADYFDITVQNASTKLKKLSSQGYFMRVEDTAPSGGIEYVYQLAH